MSPSSSPDSGLGNELRYSPSSLSTKVGRSLTYSPSSVSGKNGPSMTESSLVLPLHMKFKERSVTTLGPPIQKEGRSIVPNRAIVILTFLAIVGLLTFGGGYCFLLIESDAKVTLPVAFSDCFGVATEAAKLEKFPATDIIEELRKCVLSKTSIEDSGEGFLFAWSIYSTVGYGDRYPHTQWGQIITLLFGWLSIPLFMAFKIEMGEVISLTILYLGRGIFRGVQKLILLIFKQDIEAGEPSDFLLSSLLSLFFAVVLCFTATVHMLIDDIGWWSAFYTTGNTVMLIGLGDIVPGTNWKIFLILLPLYLFGDVLISYLFYYMHGIMRIKIHHFADFVTRRKSQKIHPNSFYEPEDKASDAKRTSVFPSVTTTSMPFTRKFSKQVEEVDFETLGDNNRRSSNS